MKRSIRRRLHIWLMVPLLVLSFVSAAFSYMVALQLARSVFDQKLVDSADSIIGRVRQKDGKVVVALPEDDELLLTQNKDTITFDVFSPEGKLLAGDSVLPRPADLPTREHPTVFRDEIIKGEEFRVVTVRASASDAGAIFVQIGETRHFRREYKRSILFAIFAPQLVLIISVLLAVWWGIGKGLNPLNRIREDVEKRSPVDLSPLEEQNAPYETRSLIKALNGLLGRIREDLHRQERFSANAAHQLRTPIAGIRTYLELMRKMSKDPELDKMLGQVELGVDRITRTVQQLLCLSRAEHAKDTHTGTVNLNNVVSEAATDVVPEAIKRNVELELNTSEEPALIKGEPVSLKELTTNLLENAIRYNKSGGHVNVHTVRNGGIGLIVEDDGIGIPKEQRDQVFERFFRISSSANIDIQGSGLGLSIVREIARAHGATVKIEDGLSGKGTKIIVQFPAAQQQK